MAERIFVRGPNWVGDVVMATPILAALRQHFPSSKIHLGLRPYALPMVEGISLVDEILPLSPSGLTGIWRTARHLRKRRYDLAIILTNSFGSALEAFMAQIPRRRGYVGDGRGLLLNERVRPVMASGQRLPMPMTQFYFRLIEDLGCRLTDTEYQLEISDSELRFADSWLAKRKNNTNAGPLIGLNPGAKFGASKLWPQERFAALGDQLVDELRATIVLLGGPGEKNLLNSIADKMKAPCLNSAEEIIPLGPLKAMIRRLDLLVTNDTGPRSIAQAMDTKVVVLMGPTDPRWTDLNNEMSIILRHDVPCGPCHKKVCDLDHACMSKISVDEVYRTCTRLLA